LTLPLTTVPILPCSHDANALVQIEPAIDLLRHLDRRHPEVLRQAGITPEDYHPKRIFRSAVETIRGSFIASSLTQRHQMLADIFGRLREQRKIAGFEPTRRGTRHDFTIILTEKPRVAAALDVKGGEGNSITITERPPWAQEFLMWCHLDGAITNQPSQSVRSIIVNRLANDLVRRGKVVDAILFKDQLCGSPLRRCPKYRGSVGNARIAPDIFLMPRERPTVQLPAPETHSLDSLYLPAMILDLFGVARRNRARHVWSVEVHLVSVKQRGQPTYWRRTRIIQANTVLEESVTHA
jgi:hypothetical protein